MKRAIGLGLVWAATTAAAAASPGPPALPRVVAIALGPAFRGAGAGVLGMDGAYSLPLGAGRSLWIFGDTLLGRWGADGRRVIDGMPSCTGVLASDADWPTGFAHARAVGGDRPRQLLQGGSPKRRRWPLDAIHLAGADWLFYVEIAAHGTGPFDFTVTGTGVARGRGRPPGEFDIRAPIWGAGAPAFGASALVDGGWLYLYAGGVPTRLARAPAGPPDRAHFVYYAGGGRWVDDWHQAAALPDSGPEASVRWNAYLGAFVMVYVPPFGRAVLARYAPRPEGPWSEPQTLVACDPADAPGVFFYGGKQHAELASEGGRRIVVSYNENAPEATVLDRPDVYWPRLARVTFTR